MAEPAEPAGRRRRRWPLFLLLPAAAFSVFLHASKALRGRDVARLRAQRDEQARARPIAAAKERRARYYRLRYFLAYPTAASHSAADLVRRLAGAAPPLRLLSVQLDAGLRDLGFTASVGAAASEEAARRQFAVFFARLQMLPGVVEASFAPAGRGADGLRLFAVSGRAELP